jgi:hypothetical protein
MKKNMHFPVWIIFTSFGQIRHFLPTVIFPIWLNKLSVQETICCIRKFAIESVYGELDKPKMAQFVLFHIFCCNLYALCRIPPLTLQPNRLKNVLLITSFPVCINLLRHQEKLVQKTNRYYLFSPFLFHTRRRF